MPAAFASAHDERRFSRNLSGTRLNSVAATGSVSPYIFVSLCWGLGGLHFLLGLERPHGPAQRMHCLLDLGAAMRGRDEAAGRSHDVDAVSHQSHADLACERAGPACALEFGEGHLQPIAACGID